MSKVSEFFAEIGDKIHETANAAWDAVVHLFKAGRRVGAAMLAAFIDYQKAHADEYLEDIVNVVVAEIQQNKSDDMWTNLKGAFDAVKVKLGEDVIKYKDTAILNTIQAGVTQLKVEALSALTDETTSQ